MKLEPGKFVEIHTDLSPEENFELLCKKGEKITPELIYAIHTMCERQQNIMRKLEIAKKFGKKLPIIFIATVLAICVSHYLNNIGY